MSVIVTGMTMPKSCIDCSASFCVEDGGMFWCGLAKTEVSIETDERHNSCPLVHVPPHGRLIDKDALLEDIDSNMIVTPSEDGSLVEVYGAEKILAHIAYAPTVIEKDGE